MHPHRPYSSSPNHPSPPNSSATISPPSTRSSALCDCNLFTDQGDFVHPKKTPALIEKALTSGKADTQHDVQEVFSQAEDHVNSKHHLVMIMAQITKKGGTVYLDGVTVNGFDMNGVTLRISARKATFNNLNCTLCDFPGIDLTEATFNGGHLNSVSLKNAKLVDTLFVGLHLMDVSVPGMQTNIEVLAHAWSKETVSSGKSSDPTWVATLIIAKSPKTLILSTKQSQFSSVFYTLPATIEVPFDETPTLGPIIETSAKPCTDEELEQLVPFPGAVVNLVQQYARSLEPPQLSAPKEKHKTDNCIIA
jgi:uncharacterized protein YjbI with pentapeptide repeats